MHLRLASRPGALVQAINSKGDEVSIQDGGVDIDVRTGGNPLDGWAGNCDLPPVATTGCSACDMDLSCGAHDDFSGRVLYGPEAEGNRA